MRHSVAVLAGKAARTAAKWRGGGSAIPGLVAERVDPAFLVEALAGVGGVVVVSGTNGKTTTTKMLVAVLRAHGQVVFTNPTGSNFTRGVISSMLPELPLRGRLRADLAVLELDEAHALKFADVRQPTHALLLNVARDQLDRFAEIDHTASLLATLAGQTTEGVVLNRDDSFIATVASQLSERIAVRWFGLHAQIADRLPELLEQDVRSAAEFRAPDPGPLDGLLRPVDDRSFEIVFGERADAQTVGPVVLKQRGLAAMINATAAGTTAKLLLGEQFDPAVAARALEEVNPPFGRGEVIDVDGQVLELVLVKNPTGFTVALGTYGGLPVATMIAINDNDADGRDVSWLYDVGFATLREQGVAMTSGLRAWDMALRLEYDDVPVRDVQPDLTEALDAFLASHSQEPTRIFCTYTAMMTLRRTLAARYGLADFGEEG
ncbi:MAG: MurT ligase domain-containing protein [Nostocoides sp.]